MHQKIIMKDTGNGKRILGRPDTGQDNRASAKKKGRGGEKDFADPGWKSGRWARRKISLGKGRK